jgi:GrpB-like predicted nucleotidyltransferase (UPF0157 family)
MAEEPGVERLIPRDVVNSQIYLAPYDSQWPRLFEREAARIRGALGDRAVLVEHVGSTSIPGMDAKPKIDIGLGVADTADEDAYVPLMQAAGYMLAVREPAWHEHRLFKGPDTDINLHTFTVGCMEIERMLRFRDRLRTDNADFELYLTQKRELSQRTWKYVQDYADAKSQVVEDIIARCGVTRTECVLH